MNRKKIVKITDDLIQEALNYSLLSRGYTSDRHDFHEGGLSAKQRKMFEGKLGEKLLKMILTSENIFFEEDETGHEKADVFDFRLSDGKTIDVKTRTKDFHTRTLEMVEQFKKNPKDIYISVRLYTESRQGFILGWFSKKDVIRINRIENNGYLDNYVLYDAELRPLEELFNIIKNN